MNLYLFIALIAIFIILFIAIIDLTSIKEIKNNQLQLLNHCKNVLNLNNEIIKNDNELKESLKVFIELKLSTLETNLIANNNSNTTLLYKEISFIGKNMVRRKHPIEKENN